MTLRLALAGFALVGLALAGLSASAATRAGEAGTYQIIVHPSNAVASIRRSFLADAYLKKITRWPDERVIRPADLSAVSPIRVRFTAEVLRRSVDSVKAYWQRRIFSGQAVPPPEFAEDAEVVSYVQQHPSAIGYISTAASTEGVRVIELAP